MSFDFTPAGTVQGSTRWLILGFFWIAFLINNIDRQVVFSIFPILTQQMHFTRVQLGLVGSVFLWSYCASNPLLGRLADVIQRERLIVASMILWSVATLGTALSYSVHYFLFWRSALGLAESLYVPATLASIAAWHPGKTRSSALAIHSSAQFSGLAMGGWLGGLTAETLGWRPGFSILAAVGILYAGVLAILLPRKPRPAVEIRKAGASPLDVFRSGCYVALLVSYIMFSTMLFIFYTWLPDFVYNKFHLSLANSGLVATGYLQTGAVVGVLTWGLVADFMSTRVHAGRYHLITLNMIACAPFAVLILTLNSLTGLKVAAAAFGFFAAGLSANVVAAAFDVITTKNYGFATGLINLAGGIGGGGGVLLVGLINNQNAAAFVMKRVAVAVVMGAVAVSLVASKRYASERRDGLAKVEPEFPLPLTVE